MIGGLAAYYVTKNPVFALKTSETIGRVIGGAVVGGGIGYYLSGYFFKEKAYNNWAKNQKIHQINKTSDSWKMN